MKHLAYQQYLQNPNQFTLNVYQAESKSPPGIMRSSRRKYETSIASFLTFNPKVFFAHARRNCQLSAGQPVPALSIPSVMMGIPAVTPCLVHNELSTLDTSKSPGPDRLHPKLLEWLATSLAEPLADLFNNSLATAVVPGYCSGRWH